MPFLTDGTHPKTPEFAQDINDYLVKYGIPWQLVDGEVVARGDEAFEVAVNTSQ